VTKRIFYIVLILSNDNCEKYKSDSSQNWPRLAIFMITSTCFHKMWQAAAGYDAVKWLITCQDRG
jgi:hypothetical protein